MNTFTLNQVPIKNTLEVKITKRESRKARILKKDIDFKIKGKIITIDKKLLI